MTTRTSYAPVRSPFTDLFERFDRLLGNLDQGWPSVLTDQAEIRLPVMDLREEPERFVLTFEVPGIKKDELEVNLEGRVLTMTARSEEEDEDKAGTWHRRERRCRSFQRIVELPTDIDPEGTEARLENGILTVSVRKAPSDRMRRIQIKG